MPAFKFKDPREAYKAAAFELDTLKPGQLSLDFSFYGLRELPPAIGRMTGLRHLDLSSNQLDELPPEIGELVGLKILNLRKNQLTHWPDAIDRLSSTEIDLRGNAVLSPAVEAEFERGRTDRLSDRLILEKVRNEIRHQRENGVRLDDDVGFLRSWIEKPLLMNPTMASGKVLARTMASYVDVESTGPVLELGPGTGAVTDALIARGVDQKRLVLVEFDPNWCAVLRNRYPRAKVIQGDAYRLLETLQNALGSPASAIVSGLPLVTKPMLTRLKLVRDAFAVLQPGAPFIQFTYSVPPPIPKSLPGVSIEASERIWLNVPPARVWVYRKADDPKVAAPIRRERIEAIEIGAPISRERAEAIFEKLNREVELPSSQTPAIAIQPDEDAKGISLPGGIAAYVRHLHQALQQEPVLDGFDHPGLAILIDAFADYPDDAARWMQHQITDAKHLSVAADILRLLCRFRPHTSAWRNAIVAAALQSQSDELRDAAIQAVESWGEPELVALLEAHADTVPWLADYATQVIEDLAG